MGVIPGGRKGRRAGYGAKAIPGRTTSRDLASLALLLVATLLVYALNTAETAAMPGLVRDLGGSALLATAQTSAFVLASVLLRLFFGPLSDRVGPRVVMIVGALSFAVPCAILPLCHTLPSLLSLRIAQAVGLAAFHPCVTQCAGRLSSERTLGRSIGSVKLAGTLSLLAGPALLFPVIDGHGRGAFFAALAAMGALAAILLVFLDDHSTGPQRHGRAGRQDSRRSALDGIPKPSARPSPRVALDVGVAALLALPFSLAMSYGVVLNLGKAIMHMAVPDGNGGLLFTFIGVGGIAGTVLTSHLVDRGHVRRGGVLTLSLAALGCAGLAYSRTIASLLATSVIFGLGYFGGLSLLACVATRDTCPERRGRFMALQQSCQDLGIVMGGLVAGTVAQATGSPVGAFVTSAVLVTSMVPLWLATRRQYPHGS